jgi:hypothetical protein
VEVHRPEIRVDCGGQTERTTGGFQQPAVAIPHDRFREARGMVAGSETTATTAAGGASIPTVLVTARFNMTAA